MLRIYRVSGSSMEPTLRDGDYVVAATRFWRPQHNKLVVAYHQDFGIIIKRIQYHSSKGITLSSDNPLGTDSRILGEIAEQQIIGPVILKIRRPVARNHTPENETRYPFLDK